MDPLFADPTEQTADEAAEAEQAAEAAREAARAAHKAKTAEVRSERAEATLKARAAVAKAREALDRLTPRLDALQAAYAEAVAVLAALEAPPIVTEEGGKPTLAEMRGQQTRIDRVDAAKGTRIQRTHGIRPPMFDTRRALGRRA